MWDWVQTKREFSDLLGMSEEELAAEVEDYYKDRGEYDDGKFDYYDYKMYVQSNNDYVLVISEAYEDFLNDLYPEYNEKAEEIIEKFEEGKITKAKVMTWDKFREVCYEDACNWWANGWTADEITADDILKEYPDDYFTDTTDTYSDDLSSAFTPSEFAAQTIEYFAEMKEEESEEESEYDYYKVVEHYDGTTEKFLLFDEALDYIKEKYSADNVVELQVQIYGYNNDENEYYGEEYSLECWNELEIYDIISEMTESE